MARRKTKAKPQESFYDYSVDVLSTDQIVDQAKELIRDLDLAALGTITTPVDQDHVRAVLRSLWGAAADALHERDQATEKLEDIEKDASWGKDALEALKREKDFHEARARDWEAEAGRQRREAEALRVELNALKARGVTAPTDPGPVFKEIHAKLADLRTSIQAARDALKG